MLILGIDTSSKMSSITLYDSEKGVIAKNSVQVKMTHSDTLMILIDNLLKNSGKSIKDVNRVAVGIGPGSFTGIRIGVGTAKGLAYSRNIDIVGVNTLDILAENIEETDREIITIIDAKKERVFYSVYGYENGKIWRKEEYRDRNINEIIEEFRRKNVIFTGDGILAYGNLIIESGENFVLDSAENCLVNSVNLCKIAQEAKPISVHLLEPEYIAKSQAERAKQNCHEVLIK